MCLPDRLQLLCWHTGHPVFSLLCLADGLGRAWHFCSGGTMFVSVCVMIMWAIVAVLVCTWLAIVPCVAAPVLGNAHGECTGYVVRQTGQVLDTFGGGSLTLLRNAAPRR